jgi:hypothetical protein
MYITITIFFSKLKEKMNQVEVEINLFESLKVIFQI